jgi:hypothetical protein
MYARNIATFLKHLIKDRRIQLDVSDPITGETLLTHSGQVVHPRLRELLQLPPLTPPASEATAGGSPASSAAPR